MGSLDIKYQYYSKLLTIFESDLSQHYPASKSSYNYDVLLHNVTQIDAHESVRLLSDAGSYDQIKNNLTISGYTYAWNKNNPLTINSARTKTPFFCGSEYKTCA